MEDQVQKGVDEVEVVVVEEVVVVVHVDSTPLEEAEVVPSVDDAEAVAEAVHNTHTEKEAEHTSYQDNHI